MDKKLNEDLNRIRKLSGLVEDDRTWTERLPDGTVRTHRYGYSDEKPGYNGYNDIGDEGNGPSKGYGLGSGQYGTGTGSGSAGIGYGSGNSGTGFGQGNSQGSSRQGTGSGSGYGQTQGLPGGGAGSSPSVGVGSGTTIQRLPSGGTITSTITGGYPGEYSDSDYDEPVAKPSKNSKSKQQRPDPEDDPSYDAYPEVPKNQYKDMSKEPSPYVNPSWQKEQDRIKQQQQQPLPSATTSLGKVPPKEPVKVEPSKEVPTLPSSTTSLGKAPPTSIAKDLLLKEPPKEVPALPNATSSLGKLPTPAPKIEPPKQEPAKNELPKEVPTLPSATTSLGKLPPKPMPKTPETTVVKHNEKPSDDTITPSHPGITVNAPTDSKPVDTSTVGSGITTPAAIPAPPVTSPKIDLPVVDLTPTHPDRPTKPDSMTPDAVDLHMLQEPPSKEPGVAQQILLPKNEPTPPTNPTKPADQPANIELMPMSKDDADKVFGKMPGSSNPSPKPSAAGAGSGSPGDSANGTSGASGEKGGGEKGGKYIPITPKTMGSPVSDQPSWAAQQRASQGKPLAGDPEIKKPEDISGAKGSIQAPNDANADIISKGNKATINMSPADAAKAQTNVFKPESPGTETPVDTTLPDDGARIIDIKGPGNKSESMERMLQLAGIKESTRVERQFLTESSLPKTNSIADTFKRLAGLK